ncbi:MAG: tRNA lysidine(34) synthetase TilS [Firmicutes bacterium]|nr:tRNA lysidine(34) synthetase TilS [Bacillota bacterium]
MDIYRRVENTVSMHGLIKPHDSVLVALSGGADSAALLHILIRISKKLEITLAAAHVNHSLRETANRDMNFCRDLCKKNGIPFFCKTADIRTGAKNAGMSEELYAREVRYEFFDSLGYDKIATAHNKNDAAETVLFHFIRGASLSGLCGIPYIRGNIIRPLLDIRKEEIIKFCLSNRIEFVTDETNFQEVYSRNKLRLDIIPQIEQKFNAGFIDTVTANAALLREDAEFIDSVAKKCYTGEVKTAELASYAPAVKRRILQLHCKKHYAVEENLPAKYIDALLRLAEKNKTGSRIDLPLGMEAVISYGLLIIRKRTKKIEFSYRIIPEKALKILETGKTVIVHKVDKNGDFYLGDTENMFVRSRKNGDFFYPAGMEGKKKLSDFFTDRKLPQRLRDETPILIKNNDIIAVGNLRFDKRFSDRSLTAYKLLIQEAEDAEKK